VTFLGWEHNRWSSNALARLSGIATYGLKEEEGDMHPAYGLIME